MNRYDYSTTWWAYQVEHPKVQITGWDHETAKNYVENTLCKHGIRWKPQDGAYAGYGSWASDYDTEFAQRSGCLFFVSSQETLFNVLKLIRFD